MRYRDILTLFLLLFFSISSFSLSTIKLSQAFSDSTQINVIIGSATYDWKKSETIGTLKGRSKSLNSKDISRTIGYPGVMSVYATEGFENSDIAAIQESEALEITLGFLVPKIILSPVLTSVSFEMSGKKLNEHEGYCEGKGHWNIYSTQNRNKIITSIPFEANYYRKPGSNEYLLSPIFKEAAQAILLNDTIRNYLKKLETDYFNQEKGYPVVISSENEKVDTDAKNVIQESIKSVVTITHKNGLGSGVIISSNGYVVTNYHVVEDIETAKIITNNKKEYEAKVVKKNKTYDLALLKVVIDNIQYMKIGNSEEVFVGQEVFAIGTPLSNQLSQTVSRGIISGIRNFNNTQLIQTDVSINSGNSGGALINEKGELIAIPTFKAGYFQSEGLGFCIPTNLVLEALNLNFK